MRETNETLERRALRRAGLAGLGVVALWLLLTRTRIGLVIQAALTHPEMVESYIVTSPS